MRLLITPLAAQDLEEIGDFFKTLPHPFTRILKHTRPWRLFTPAIRMP